jgi:stage II sporulation protein D
MLSFLSSSPQTQSIQAIWFKRVIFAFCLWLCQGIPVYARVLMRVAIVENTSNVTLGSSVEARLLDSQGNPVAQVSALTPLAATAGGQGIQIGSISSPRLYLQPTTPDGLVFIEKNWYRGLVELVPEKGRIIAVNQVGLDDYVSSVVGSEMGHRFPREALKSQAVAARTYAIFHRNQRLKAAFDLGDEQTWQVYKGVASESSATQAAARETAGQVITYGGKVINAVFHSSSGGHTEDVENVWSEPLPYLRGVPDYDVKSPVASWTLSLPVSKLQSMAAGIGELINVEVVQRTRNGRAALVRLTGTQGSKDIKGSDFRAQMGLKSTLFSISPQSSNTTTASLVPVAGSPRAFQVSGHGFGHGIGMSQWGAASLAGQGWTYQQILAHYYQGTALASVQTP